MKKTKSKLSPEARAFFAAKGAQGGKATGPAKARSREHYQAAARARWARQPRKREKRQPKPKT